MRDEFFGSKLGGEVEVDETFIGGKARNMHVLERNRRITGAGSKDKTAVMGIYERESGKVRATVIPSRRKKVLQNEVRKHVTAGAALYSDALQSYERLATEYAHQVETRITFLCLVLSYRSLTPPRPQSLCRLSAGAQFRCDLH
jgi:hypothetical protein